MPAWRLLAICGGGFLGFLEFSSLSLFLRAEDVIGGLLQDFGYGGGVDVDVASLAVACCCSLFSRFLLSFSPCSAAYLDTGSSQLEGFVVGEDRDRLEEFVVSFQVDESPLSTWGPVLIDVVVAVGPNLDGG